MIRGVLFDMDGLLLDTERLGARILPRLCRERGYEVPPDLYGRMLGRGYAEDCQLMREALGAEFPSEAVLEDFRAALQSVARNGGMPVKKGMAACLAGLKARGVLRALATSTRRATVELYIRHTPEMQNALDSLTCGDDVERGKPAPDIYLLAARRLGLSPEECLGVEDSLSGLKSLKAAGIAAVMIPDLVEPDERFEGLVSYRLDHLGQLCALVDRLNLSPGVHA